MGLLDTNKVTLKNKVYSKRYDTSVVGAIFEKISCDNFNVAIIRVITGVEGLNIKIEGTTGLVGYYDVTPVSGIDNENPIGKFSLYRLDHGMVPVDKIEGGGIYLLDISNVSLIEMSNEVSVSGKVDIQMSLKEFSVIDLLKTYGLVYTKEFNLEETGNMYIFRSSFSQMFSYAEVTFVFQNYEIYKKNPLIHFTSAGDNYCFVHDTKGRLYHKIIVTGTYIYPLARDRQAGAYSVGIRNEEPLVGENVSVKIKYKIGEIPYTNLKPIQEISHCVAKYKSSESYVTLDFFKPGESSDILKEFKFFSFIWNDNSTGLEFKITMQPSAKLGGVQIKTSDEIVIQPPTSSARGNTEWVKNLTGGAAFYIYPTGERKDADIKFQLIGIR